jgi:hypothetical protein
MTHPDKNALSPAARIGELVALVALLAMGTFFAIHQSAHTGFFRENFGPFEMLCLYGPIVVALVPLAIRAVTGRRSTGWLPEALANIALALGTLWLLIVFPLDFTHLMDLFPGVIRDLFGWVNDGIGRIPMVFQVVVMPITAAINLWRYLSSRRQIAPNLS